MKHYVHINNILGIETNADKFVWLFGKNSPESSFDEYSNCLIKVLINIVDDNAVINSTDIENCSDIFQYFRVDAEKRVLIYDRQFFFKIPLKFKIEFCENNVIATVGKSYYNFVKLRFMNLHSIQYILSDVVTAMLISNGYAPMYCATNYFPNLDKSAIIFAPPACGKTTTCFDLCDKFDAVFVSEDVSVTDGNEIFSAMWTNSQRKNNTKILDARNGKSPKLIELQTSNKFCDKANITDVFFLEESSKMRTIDKETSLNRMSILNNYLFPYANSPVLMVLNYFMPGFSIKNLQEKQQKIYLSVINKSTYNTIKAKDGIKVAETIYNTLIK